MTRAHDAAESLKSSAHEQIEAVKECVETGRDQAAERIRRVGTRFLKSSRPDAGDTRVGRQPSPDLARDNPLALGAVALAAGVGVGFLLPSTDREDELLGPTRERLMSEARETVREVGNAAKDVASMAKDTAQDVKRGLTQPSSGV